jgi:hypothetical protein
MQFRLSTLLLLFVVLWSSLAVFGLGGIIVFAFLVFLAIGIARSWTVLWALPFLLPMLVLAGLLLPAIQTAREVSLRMTCHGHLKQIALALHNYRTANGCFPPAYVADKNGCPMHSWRVLILPYLEADALYKQYNFNEPWDGPHNKKLLAARPPRYVCPSDENAHARGATQTSYVAVVGANAAWSGEQPKKAANVAPSSQTIMVVEVTDAGINWSEPRDLSLDALEAAGARPSTVTVSSKHGSGGSFFYTYRYCSGANAALADGSVRYLPPDRLAPNLLPSYLRIGGYKEEDSDNNDNTPSSWNGERHLNWGNCLALAVWLASVGLLLYRAVRSRRALTVKVAVERAGERITDQHR